MSDQPFELRLRLDSPDAEPEELDELTRQLIDELRQLPVESVTRDRETTKVPGAKTGAAEFIAAVAVVALPKFVGPLLDSVKSWLERKKLRSVTFTGTLNGHPIDFRGTPQDLEKLVRALTPQSQKPAATT